MKAFALLRCIPTEQNISDQKVEKVIQYFRDVVVTENVNVIFDFDFELWTLNQAKCKMQNAKCNEKFVIIPVQVVVYVVIHVSPKTNTVLLYQFTF